MHTCIQWHTNILFPKKQIPVIDLVYTRITKAESIYQVYTRYIPCLNFLGFPDDVRFVVLAQWLERCAVQSEDCRFCSKRRVFALVARAREAFLNLRNRNSLLPTNKTLAVLTHTVSQDLREAYNQCVRTNLFSLLLNNCLKARCMLERNETSQLIGSDQT
jgi:hypothetical protein